MLNDIKVLKDLSWYTTVPLFVCASLLNVDQISNASLPHFLYLVAEHFVITVAALLFVFFLWLQLSSRFDRSGIITLVAATFLLSLSAVGVGLYFSKSPSAVTSTNVIWFVSFGSLAFNIFNIQLKTEPNANPEKWQ